MDRIAETVTDAARALRRRRVARRRPPVPRTTATPRVAIVGAGAAGLCAAIRLQEAGVHTFTIYEQSDGVGGTWRDNTYPGAACDVPSHLYCFSFHQKRDWSRKFAPQAEILEYFESCVDDFHLRHHIRFRSGVEGARWDAAATQWVITLTTGEVVEADLLISGVGQLNRPHIPEVEGLIDFEGDLFHSARWNHDVDLTGKRVVVVGNGASAIQFVPEVAKQAASVTIMQRSPNWVGPKPDYEYSERALAAFHASPALARMYRNWIYANFELRFAWMRDGNRFAKLVQSKITQALQPLVSERLPREAVIPDYPLGCKRILISNDWYPTLLRPEVRVVTDRIEAMEADGVRAGGELHEADVIIFATGFTSTEFLSPMRLEGVGGRTLDEAWPRGAEAYLGMCVPGFPNLFLLYGPNTNLGHNSIIFMIERQVEYLVDCVRELVDSGAAALDVRPEALASATAEVEELMHRTVWEAGCSSWYKNAAGRVTNNWPGPTILYWWRTLTPRFEDFTRIPRRSAVRADVG